MQTKLSAFSPAGALLVLLTGCQSTGVDTRKATVKSLEEMRTALTKSEEKIDTVVQSVNALANAQGDITGRWRNYTSAVAAMDADSKRVRSLRDDAMARKVEHLRGWDERMKDIQEADLRTRAEERRDATSKEFDELGAQADEARSTFDKWMTVVSDVRAYLESDLSQAGVQSVADKITRINEEAVTVKKELKDVNVELDKVIASINTVTPKES